MFDRKAYKAIAKKQLHGRYAAPVLATLSMIGILGILYIPIAIAGRKGMEISETSPFGRLMPVIIVCLAGILQLAFYRLAIALSKTTEKQSFSVYLEGFNYWAKGILGILWMMLWLMLWGLCFYIPIFIKIFSYSQMFLILAEYPDMSVRQAMTLSKKITRGYKFDLFVMSLSFLGWELLAIVIPPLELWLVPYKAMAETNAYHSIKAQQIAAGVVSEADFSGKPATDTNDDSTAEVQAIAETEPEEKLFIEPPATEPEAESEKLFMEPTADERANTTTQENSDDTEVHFDEQQ